MIEKPNNWENIEANYGESKHIVPRRLHLHYFGL